MDLDKISKNILKILKSLSINLLIRSNYPKLDDIFFNNLL